MSEVKHDKITAKIFIGFLISSEIKMYLRQSQAWQQAQVLQTKSNELLITHYKDKDYIGLFWKSNSITLEELKEIQVEIRQLMLVYCPLLAIEKLKVVTFPQIFIS